MAHASGKYAYFICDTCGFRYPYKKAKGNWENFRTCSECYEPKHPQLTPKVYGADPQGLLDARPQKPDLTSSFTLYINNNPNNDPLINSYSMIPSSSDNILGTPLTSFSAQMSVGNVTVEIS